MKFLRLWLIVCVAASGLGVSCGKKNKDKDGDENPGTTALVGAAALVGPWKGFYRTLDDGGKVQGINHPTEVNFAEDGKFSMQLTDDTAAKAAGTWQEFQGKSLFLTIKESTLSRLRAASGILELKYDLTGSYMHMHTVDFEFLISRKVETPAENSVHSGPIAGRWVCENSGIVTRLVVSDNYAWRATMTSPTGGMVAMSGSGSFENGSAILKIDSSSQQTRPNSVLIFSPEGTAGKLQARSDGGAESLGSCSRE